MFRTFITCPKFYIGGGYAMIGKNGTYGGEMMCGVSLKNRISTWN